MSLLVDLCKKIDVMKKERNSTKVNLKCLKLINSLGFNLSSQIDDLSNKINVMKDELKCTKDRLERLEHSEGFKSPILYGFA